MADRNDQLERFRALAQGEEDLFIGDPVDESLLLQFLRYANFNVEKAFEKMKLVFRLKKENGDFYAHERKPVLDKVLSKEIHTMLDNRDQIGRRIYLVRLRHIVYGEFTPQELSQVDDLWLTLAVQEEETQKNGLVLLIDMEAMPWKFLRYFTPHNIKVTTAKAENIPIKHLQYHVLNAGLFCNTVISLVFPFLSQATRESIFFHKSVASLHKHIVPSALPVEYGGLLQSPDQKSLVSSYLDTATSRLSELLSYGYKKK